MSDCVIYCRVSSERQVKEGSGLQSQEQRCRSYAQMQDYRVVQVFSDEGISGALLDRPGIKQLLTYLRTHRRKEPIFVVVDDISRIARDVQTHLRLRAAVEACGGKLVSPSFNFENNALGEFMEVIFAGIAQYGRTGNREQVLNRQRARLEQGFWTFPAPPGYVYQKHSIYKKILVPDETRSVLIKQALESFACGRFLTQREIMDYLRQHSYYPEVWKSFGSKYEMAVKRLLDNIAFYAGYIEYKPWHIERRIGQHQALISPATMAVIEERLCGKKTKALRSDSQEAFPLRNFVRCPECGRPLTASWTKGKRYARYHCYNQRNCSRYGHTIPSDRLHAEFEVLLEHLTASDQTLKVILIAVEDAWKARQKEWGEELKKRRLNLQTIEEDISAMVNRIGRTDDEDLVREYERQVKSLKTKRLEAEAALLRCEQGLTDFPTAYEKVGTFLRNPCLIWKTGSFQLKKTLCRMVFSKAPVYVRSEGFGTTDYSLPYRITHDFSTHKKPMVEVTRETWYQFIEIILEWSAHCEGFDLLEPGQSYPLE